MSSSRSFSLASVAAVALALLFSGVAWSQTGSDTTVSSAASLTLPDAAAQPPTPPADAPSMAANPHDAVIVAARDAFARHDRARLATLRATALSDRHSLAEWVDYWELTNRIAEVGADEIEAFYQRWPNTYLEDRLRNDWLLEAGRRRDWTAFARDYPRFRMNDDREVSCYATLLDHVAGKDVHDVAMAQWLAQKDADNGCQLMAQTLHDDKVFTDDDIWRRLRQTAEFGRARAARFAAQLLGKFEAKRIASLWDDPVKFLLRWGGADTTRPSDEIVLALARMGANDPAATALQLKDHWQSGLTNDNAAWIWAVLAKQGAQSLLPDAVDWSERAWASLKPRKGANAPDRPDWGDDVLGWHVRAALRAGVGASRWKDVARSIDAMSPTERAEGNWVYWRARAEIALARDGTEGDADRAEARASLNVQSTKLGFYGLLAAEDLGTVFVLPSHPVPMTSLERGMAHGNPGLQRALALVGLGLREEGRREWNYTLRGMNDRDLLAAAQWACDLGDWQLCINTSERTRSEIDLTQRYPMPFQRDITAAAQGAGLDPAYVFGLIRQETRFMDQARSSVGASGLMQLMPATARWAAKKGGIDYRPDLIADPTTNLRIGTFYLRMVLDSFGGSVPMATAAYNAGPARPRRWRGTVMLDPAIWTENVPFFETRDYVKKVTTNAAIYSAMLTNRPPHPAFAPGRPDRPARRRAAAHAGHAVKTYVVGGAVRDELLGQPVNDRDWVVTGASPQQMLDAGFLPVGKDFPVFLHPDTKEEYALARIERKTAPGYHGFSFHTAPDVRLEDDLVRRDLTINAIARDADGTLIDPHGGQRDIAARVLRHVSGAFAEDPVRILRLARFAARWPDFHVAPETLTLMREMVAAGEADALVAERVWQELSRGLMESAPARMIEVLREVGALRVLLPEVDRLFGVPQPAQHHPEIDTGIHTLMVLDRCVATAQPLPVRYACLVHDLGKGTTRTEELPRHIAHEARGETLIRALNERLRVPVECGELALLAAREHTPRPCERDAQRRFHLAAAGTLRRVSPPGSVPGAAGGLRMRRHRAPRFRESPLSPTRAAGRRIEDGTSGGHAQRVGRRDGARATRPGDRRGDTPSACPRAGHAQRRLKRHRQRCPVSAPCSRDRPCKRTWRAGTRWHPPSPGAGSWPSCCRLGDRPRSAARFGRCADRRPDQQVPRRQVQVRAAQAGRPRQAAA